MNQFNVIALTHRQLGLDLVGKYHIEPELQAARFRPHFEEFEIKEFVFLSTCNRVEFFFRSTQIVDTKFVFRFLSVYYPTIEHEHLSISAENSRIYNGLDAIRHLFHVACSLDSLVVGEREIISQVRSAFNRSVESQMCGDFIRIAITNAIETAKQVYTETEIATKPVSVVNLGFRKLLDHDFGDNANIVFIGAGTTMEAIAGNVKSMPYKSLKVFNRTPEKAKALANNLNGQGYGLDLMEQEIGDFDVIVTCTGSELPILTLDKFRSLINGSKKRKVILDLAIPTDVDPAILEEFSIDYISIEDLKVEAKNNLKEREKEVFQCENLVELRLIKFEEAFRTRKLELAMASVPKLMKEIKTTAIDKKFAKEIEIMDEAGRQTMFNVLDYLEKKYISIPMKMAKQVVLDKDLKDSIID